MARILTPSALSKDPWKTLKAAAAAADVDGSLSSCWSQQQQQH
jgi:hypothetical protein